jgi:uncharacterized membrane protein
MPELVVVGFERDMHRASEVLNTLRDLNNNWVIELTDAVAVHRGFDNKLRVDQSFETTAKQGAAWGGLLGGLLGALVAIPFTGGVSAAAAAVAVGSVSVGTIGATAGALGAASLKKDSGISDELVDRVGALVQPGDSAIFALLRSVDPEAVAAQFKGYGGTVLHTTLSSDRRAKVQQTLQGR